MLGWIPFIGPLIDGIVSIFKGAYGVKIAQIQGDTSAIQAAADLTKTFKDDIGVRLARDLVMFPIAIWTSLVTWDNIVLHVKPEWVWTVERFPPQLAYLPYAFFCFLFGMAWINRK